MWAAVEDGLWSQTQKSPFHLMKLSWRNLLMDLHNFMWYIWLAECFSLKTSYLLDSENHPIKMIHYFPLIQLLFYASLLVGFTVSIPWFFNFEFLVFRVALLGKNYFIFLKMKKKCIFSLGVYKKMEWAKLLKECTPPNSALT